MAKAFSGAFLAFAVAYTLFAFGLPFMAVGRIGPGFFPQILGVTLIVISAYSLVQDFREPARESADDDAPDGASGDAAGEGSGGYGRAVALMILVTVVFVVMLNVVGALVAMVLFMFAVLYLLNREGMVMNVVLSVLLPVSVYLMFDVWLNTTLPQGMFTFLG
ncbi:MAG: tripartite tricarboxylate transporter TctB family protein [Rubrobacteraceae bacterium]